MHSTASVHVHVHVMYLNMHAKCAQKVYSTVTHIMLRIHSDHSPVDEESNDKDPSEGREEHRGWDSAHSSKGQRSNSKIMDSGT